MIRKENREWDLTVQTEDFKREIGLLRDLRHTNVLRSDHVQEAIPH